MASKALITGISGQDGSYLAELLLEKDYTVAGTVRPSQMEDANYSLPHLQHIIDYIKLYPIDFGSYPSVCRVVADFEPEELYHLAAQSYVSYDFEMEFSTLETNINATHYLLAAVKDFCPDCKFYFAGSSEMFGDCRVFPQNEKTPFNPRSIYGLSKLTGYHLVRNYRTQYSIDSCAGILYNHESPRRGLHYVTRKITSSIARIRKGEKQELRLGNLDARRDWGHAEDYVRAMWMMMQYGLNDDYVVASGKLHSVREFLEIAFAYVGLDYREYVVTDERFFRPSEAVPLVGDATKVKQTLGWERRKAFEDIVYEMIQGDLEIYG